MGPGGGGRDSCRPSRLQLVQLPGGPPGAPCSPISGLGAPPTGGTTGQGTAPKGRWPSVAACTKDCKRDSVEAAHLSMPSTWTPGLAPRLRLHPGDSGGPARPTLDDTGAPSRTSTVASRFQRTRGCRCPDFPRRMAPHWTTLIRRVRLSFDGRRGPRTPDLSRVKRALSRLS